ncbi:MAG: hypothetical protein Q8O89_02535 [Nanoarchaeota archaeon]|nr:hypothetical protein [Nanoarchaeota archaeon]
MRKETEKICKICKQAFLILLISLMVLTIAGCTDEPAASTQPSEDIQKINADINRASVVSADKATGEDSGSAEFDITFLPEVGRYQANAIGKLRLYAPLKKAKIEVYTKTEMQKKVVAAINLGDIPLDRDVNIDVILSKNRVTYKINNSADSILNGLSEYKNHALGIDLLSEDAKANWESREFSFDDEDAFIIANKTNQ